MPTKEMVERFLKKSGSDKVVYDNIVENEHGFMSCLFECIW